MVPRLVYASILAVGQGGGVSFPSLGLGAIVLRSMDESDPSFHRSAGAHVGEAVLEAAASQ